MNQLTTQDDQYLSVKYTSTIKNMGEFQAKHGLGFKDLAFMFDCSILDAKDMSYVTDPDAHTLKRIQDLDVIIDRYKSVKDVFTEIDAQQALKTIHDQAKEIEQLKAQLSVYEAFKNLDLVKSLRKEGNDIPTADRLESLKHAPMGEV